MRKVALGVLSLLGMCASAQALESRVDKFDSGSAFSVYPDTKNIVYVDKCARYKLKQYEWQVWEGNYGIRCEIQPVANITIKRKKEDLFTMDPSSFIVTATQISATLGGQIVCYVKFKKNEAAFGLESITFRAYKQYFVSGNKEWETFCNDRVMKGLPLTLDDVRKWLK